MQVEHNDVDISALFHWSKAFEVMSKDAVITVVFMRVLGDADINRARVYALRESAVLRRNLRDVNSDDRLAAIKDIEDLEKDDIANYVVLFSTRDISQKMWKDIKIPYPKQPKSDAPLEKLEKYQKEVDEFPEKREKAIREAIEKEITNLKKSLEQRSKEDLYKDYVRLLIDELCEQRVLIAFREYSAYLGCYKDDAFKERFFESFDDFQNLPAPQKVEFIQAYRELELGSEEIKKLREATL